MGQADRAGPFYLNLSQCNEHKHKVFLFLRLSGSNTDLISPHWYLLNSAHRYKWAAKGLIEHGKGLPVLVKME